MALEPVLIAGEWRQPANPTGSFTAVDPSTASRCPESYPVSSIDDVTAAFRAADDAVVALRDRSPLEAIARFLDDYAARIEARRRRAGRTRRARDGPAARAAPRNVELPRTTNQLRQGAAAARDRSWCARRPSTPRRTSARATGRWAARCVVFGPEQLPVRVQLGRGRRLRRGDRRRQPGHRQGEHRPPGHHAAARRAGAARRRAPRGCRPAMVQLIYRTPPDVGFALVSDAARRRDRLHRQQERRPQAEGGGRRAPASRSTSRCRARTRCSCCRARSTSAAAAIAKELYDSCAMGAGQFCTRPGLAIVPKGDKGDGVRRRAGRRCSRRARRARCSARRARPRSRRR